MVTMICETCSGLCGRSCEIAALRTLTETQARELAEAKESLAAVLSWFERISDAYTRGSRDDVSAAIEDMQSVLEDLGLDPEAKAAALAAETKT